VSKKKFQGKTESSILTGRKSISSPITMAKQYLVRLQVISVLIEFLFKEAL